MNLVLNEVAWTKETMERYELGDKPALTLERVAKYYNSMGWKKDEIRKGLEEYLLRCDPYASVVLWDKTISNAVNNGMKRPFVMIDCILITKPEIERIKAIEGIQTQRLAFTLLCVAKYMMIVHPASDGWVNVPEKDIVKMANINTSYKRQNLLYKKLLDEGLLQASKKITNLNVRVLYMEDGETAISVTDFRNLGNQYMMYNGGPFFVCKNCGLTERVPKGANVGNMKYCHDCAAKVYMRQSVNSVMRHRQAKKEAARLDL